LGRDHYAVLGLEPNCTVKDITKAYRKLALKHHPDKNKGKPNATKNFQKISNAHDVLKGARQTFDREYQYRKNAPRHEEQQRQQRQQPQAPAQSPNAVQLAELERKMAMIASVIQVQREEAQRLKELWEQIRMGAIPEQFRDYADFGGDENEVVSQI